MTYRLRNHAWPGRSRPPDLLLLERQGGLRRRQFVHRKQHLAQYTVAFNLSPSEDSRGGERMITSPRARDESQGTSQVSDEHRSSDGGGDRHDWPPTGHLLAC